MFRSSPFPPLAPKSSSNAEGERKGALQDGELEGRSCVDAHSHSSALSSRIDRAATILGEAGAAGSRTWLATRSLVGAVAAGLLLGFIGVLLLGLGLSDGLGVLLVLVDGPVKDVVVLEAFTYEEIAENLAQIRVVGFVIEAQTAGVVEVDGELVGETTAQDLGRGRHLLLHDPIVFLLLGGRLKTLPRQRATAEVQHDVAQRLHVITARLFYTPYMSVWAQI